MEKENFFEEGGSGVAKRIDREDLVVKSIQGEELEASNIENKLDENDNNLNGFPKKETANTNVESSQMVMDKTQRVLYSKKNQEYWTDKRDSSLESAYAMIAPDIPLVNVEHKELFLEKCAKYYKEMEQDALGIKKIDRWDEYEIERMFGKGLNPTSLKTALNNIKYLVENISSDNDTVRVVEFGPGSGWSTLMLRNQLHKKFPNKKIELISVDKSPHSVVATQNSLDYYEIPWQTEIRDGNVETIPDKDKYVTLVLDDFVEFANKQPNNYFDGYFSSHGTAYLSEQEYEKLLASIKTNGKPGAVFVADSLDPLYTVKLDTLHLVLCSIFPSISKNMQEYTYGKSLLSNSKYFPGQEVKKLTRVHNAESELFYNWNNYLLSKLKLKYILQMLKSIRITTDVIEEYREDVYPSYLVNNLVKKEGLNNWEEMKNLPECPLYITNCAFRLKK
ncbi:MAG: class I SAM-dependent methyltransferase [Candidatus Dojkabacteria bacterium]|nr:class I SAM-dependent methyltransferase [Candidatus Dojkabacteria bacterium]